MQRIAILIAVVCATTSLLAQQKAPLPTANNVQIGSSAAVKEHVVLVKPRDLIGQQDSRVSVIYVRFSKRLKMDEILKCKSELFPQNTASLLGPQHFKSGGLVSLGQMLLAGNQPSLAALSEVAADKMVVGCLLNPNFTADVSDPIYSGTDEAGRPFRSSGVCYAANLSIDQQRADGPRIRDNIAQKLGMNIIFNSKAVPAKGEKTLVTFTYVAGASVSLPGDTFRPGTIDTEYASCCFIVRSK